MPRETKKIVSQKKKSKEDDYKKYVSQGEKMFYKRLLLNQIKKVG